MREHLQLKAEIESLAMQSLRDELKRLRRDNENLRVSNKTLLNKPDRRELRLLYLYDRPICEMLSQSPVFAPTWQAHLDSAAEEMAKVDKGAIALVRRLIRPSFGQLSAPARKLLDNS